MHHLLSFTYGCLIQRYKAAMYQIQKCRVAIIKFNRAFADQKSDGGFYIRSSKLEALYCKLREILDGSLGWENKRVTTTRQ